MDAWSHKFKVGDVLVSLSNYSSRVMSVPIALFFVDKTNQLRPIAIQLVHIIQYSPRLAPS